MISGYRGGRWYETIFETKTVGVYHLNATLVLTSLLFSSAARAIVYAILMAIGLSIVRFLTVGIGHEQLFNLYLQSFVFKLGDDIRFGAYEHHFTSFLALLDQHLIPQRQTHDGKIIYFHPERSRRGSKIGSKVDSIGAPA